MICEFGLYKFDLICAMYIIALEIKDLSLLKYLTGSGWCFVSSKAGPLHAKAERVEGNKPKATNGVQAGP